MKIILHGYGAMNKLIHNELGDQVVGIISREECPNKIGYEDLLNIDYDLVIDFSHFSVVDYLINILIKNPHPVIIATTKLQEKTLDNVNQLSKVCPVFQDYNTSFGFYAVNETLRYMNNLLQGYDKDIIEQHHRYKVDAPSGTAVRLFNTLNENNDYNMVCDYHNHEGKKKNDIGVVSVRSGAIVGTHEVVFGSVQDIITIKHEALNKSLFADGAIKISSILINKNNGLYHLEDIYKKENE